MILKKVPEDFIVEEIFNFDNLEKNGEFAYFWFKKTNISQINAINQICSFFGLDKRKIKFAGTKDKIGVTKQVISIQKLGKKTIEKKVPIFNKEFDNLELKYIGHYDKRVNLGENLGNKFKIIIRDLKKEEVEKLKKNSSNIEKKGILNYFDSQRFGFANNSHKIGLYILKNRVDLALYEILTSLPNNPKEDRNMLAGLIKENWNKIKSGDVKTIEMILEDLPEGFNLEKKILEHIKKNKNDFAGAFRLIHKKLRTLYINAYQSYIFNELLKNFSNKKELPLILSTTKFEDDNLKKEVLKLLEKDNISLKNFELKSFPEFRLKQSYRRTKVYPKNFKILNIKKDDLYEEKIKVEVEFELEKGAYATNVIKHILEEQDL